MGRVDGKVALVTGSGTGMGRASARLLAAEGAKVVIAEWNEEAAVATRELITSEGGTASEIVLDASQPENAERMVQFAVDQYGTLDVLHCQVWALHAGLVEHLELEGWEMVLRHVLTSAFLGMKYAIPVMRAGGGGSIIATSSISSFTTDPGVAAYGAAKAGVTTLAKYAAVENGRHGIRVNTVSPGTVESSAFLQIFGEDTTNTKFTAAPNPDAGPQKTPEEMREIRRQMAESTALKRITQPEEIAEVVLFLASDASRAITGADLVADGGVSPRIAYPSLFE